MYVYAHTHILMYIIHHTLVFLLFFVFLGFHKHPSAVSNHTDTKKNYEHSHSQVVLHHSLHRAIFGTPIAYTRSHQCQPKVCTSIYSIVLN